MYCLCRFMKIRISNNYKKGFVLKINKVYTSKFRVEFKVFKIIIVIICNILRG